MANNAVSLVNSTSSDIYGMVSQGNGAIPVNGLPVVKLRKGWVKGSYHWCTSKLTNTISSVLFMSWSWYGISIVAAVRTKTRLYYYNFINVCTKIWMYCIEGTVFDQIMYVKFVFLVISVFSILCIYFRFQILISSSF